VVDDLGEPLHCRGHIALQERVHAHLVAQILHGLQQLGVGRLNGSERFEGRLVVAGGHVHIRHEGIDLVGVGGVGVLAQEVAERSDTLAEGRALQVGDLHVVVHRLLAQTVVETELHSRRVGQFGFLEVANTQVTMPEVETGVLGDGVLLLLDLSKVVDSLLVVAGLVVRHTEQVHIVAHQLLLLRHA